MKKILSIITLITFLIGTITISSCSSGTSAGGQVNPTALSYSVDQSVYFTITFNGQTSTTYGLKKTYNGLTTPEKSFCGASITSIGTTNSWISFLVLGSGINNYLQQFGITQNLPQIDNVSSFIRDGTAIGTYYSGNDGIIVLSTSSSTFYPYATPDTSPSGNSTITVTSIDQNYVTGNVSLKLIDGNNIIPAIGSFRLHNL